MGSDTVCYIKSDLKNKFSYFKFEKDTVFQRNKVDKNNNLVFILHGEMEVIYGDLYPRLISDGNMILLTPLSRCVCKAVSTVELIILGFGTLNHSCDKYIFQNLTPFFSLIKYEFRELEIRESLDRFLQLMLIWLQEKFRNCLLFCMLTILRMNWLCFFILYWGKIWSSKNWSSTIIYM